MASLSVAFTLADARQMCCPVLADPLAQQEKSISQPEAGVRFTGEPQLCRSELMSG